MSVHKHGSAAFAVLQKIGRSFFLPISVLPVAGLLLGIGASFSNPDTVALYGLQNIMGQGTLLNHIFILMSAVGTAVFANLPLMFAMAVALGMANEEKAVAVLSSAIAFIVMHVTINNLLVFGHSILADGSLAETVRQGTIGTVLGIKTLEMGVFGGIITGLGVAWLHNRYYKIELPVVFAFFGGVRFVPIISTFAFIVVGALSYLIWPYVQQIIAASGTLVLKAGYFGTFIFGFMERLLIPFGLHHVFYTPFWYTALGGTATIDGQTVYGAQKLFFAELASPSVKHFSVEAARFMTGKYAFMMGGLPGAALAMYHTAKPSKRKIVGGLLFSAALTSFLTGITEPIEFTFLFVAPFMFIVHCCFAGLSFMLSHLLNIAVGTTFSCGLIDLTLYGILQGNAKTNWVMLLPLFLAYFVGYYFFFKWAILKWNLQTPGREPDDQESKLYTKADYQASKAAGKNEQLDLIIEGLGGKDNLENLDCCATRLRLNVKKPELVKEDLLKKSGAVGVILKGHGIQVIYGPQVSTIKPNLETYLKDK
ncbi:MAG: PTS transporter subunit EIIC [Elusimicrobium sp.]|jgi:glucose-like phosphotransferase system IIB component|nr:PTS transporter subunit EIIC [Elusimicrobium sp.]